MEKLEDIKVNPPVQTEVVSLKNSFSNTNNMYQSGNGVQIPILLQIILSSGQSSSFKEELSSFQQKVSKKGQCVRQVKREFSNSAHEFVDTVNIILIYYCSL